jgi:protein-disulfide isomerase
MNSLLRPVDATDHIQGAVDAPVTLIEYGDFECPYCGAMYAVIKTAQRIMGPQLRFVYRHFPLVDAHAHALHAAEFSEAAAIHGKFWEAHDVLYENQTSLGDRALKQYWAQLHLPAHDLTAAFEGGDDERIQGDFAGGVRSGVNSTPSLFINGQPYSGDHDVESLLTALSAAANRNERSARRML